MDGFLYVGFPLYDSNYRFTCDIRVRLEDTWMNQYHMKNDSKTMQVWDNIIKKDLKRMIDTTYISKVLDLFFK